MTEQVAISKSLLPHQLRVIDELNELDGRIRKLLDFMCSETFAGLPADEQHMLSIQASSMKVYYEVLTLRISKF